MKLYGDYNDPQASSLQVNFVKCNSLERDDCKSDSEIRDWFNSKFILILENQKKFISNEFGDKTLKAESSMQWIPTNEGVKNITKTRMITR